MVHLVILRKHDYGHVSCSTKTKVTKKSASIRAELAPLTSRLALAGVY